MKTVFLVYLPWVLVCVLALALVVALTLLAYLFGFLMSGQWYRWKHRGALRERDVLDEVKRMLIDERDLQGEVPASVADKAIALINKVLVP